MKTERKTKTIQVRLTETDYQWLEKASYAMGTNTSALVRQLVQMSINAVKASEKTMQEAKEKAKAEKENGTITTFNQLESEVEVNEDIKTV